MFYGVGGTSSVYNFKVEKYQSSEAMLWIQNGPTDRTDLIGIGWHVSFILLIYIKKKLSQNIVFTQKNIYV